jgi:DNA-binding beta-propeller fold protein YncE
MQQLTKLLTSINYPIHLRLLLAAFSLALVSCGGGSSTPTYTIGGTVSGLTSGSLVLKNNNGDDLTINANSTSFTFATAQASGAAYAVTAGTRPSRLACDITNNTGTIAGVNVTGVTITCISPVYVVNSGSDTVSMYAVNTTTGTLTTLEMPTVASGTIPIAIAVNPAGTFAYVANIVSNTVSMYAINASTGILTALSTPTVATGTSPSSIIINPAGTFAYVTNETSNTVSMYAINATTGILTALATPTVATGTSPSSINVNPAGTFVYVTNKLSNTVSMYAINATTGMLTALATPTVATGTEATSIAFK